METHGTGTVLGDPIEVAALWASLGSSSTAQPFVFGAIKTQLGHTEFAAGCAGLARIVFSLKQRVSSASLHLCRINRYTELDNSTAMLLPIQITSHRTARSRGVSSFGFTGTNAHCVLLCGTEVWTRAVAVVLAVIYQLIDFPWWEHECCSPSK
jgi:acyl transferase domain-containing protein